MNSDSVTNAAALPVAGRPSVRLSRAAVVLIVIGIACSLPALLDVENRARLGFGYLWGFTFVWTITLGGLFFVGLQHVTSSVWSVVLRRAGEAIAAPMWLVGLLFVPVLLLVLFPTEHAVFPWADPSIVANDHLLIEKRAYLNVPFFAIRAVLYFIVWIAFARYFVHTSLRQDHGQGGVSASLRMRKVAAPFMLVFAITATFAGIDWLLSLNPYWFSTIFGVYVFSGMTVTGLAAITIVTVWLRRSGRLDPAVVTDEHLYSLGALLFAFTCFWAYIAFSQYMLVWYANLPEESFYIYERVKGPWQPVSIALAVVRFGLPFAALLSRRAKMHAPTLFWVSLLVLAGQLLDLYWLIMPELHDIQPALSWQELGPPLLLIGILALYVAWFVGRHSPLAVGDPRLAESQAFHL